MVTLCLVENYFGALKIFILFLERKPIGLFIPSSTKDA
jgi:hypothetical protein